MAKFDRFNPTPLERKLISDDAKGLKSKKKTKEKKPFMNGFHFVNNGWKIDYHGTFTQPEPKEEPKSEVDEWLEQWEKHEYPSQK